MFGVLIIEDSSEVLFEHKVTKFFRLRTAQVIEDNNEDFITNKSSLYLSQVLAPLILSKSILKSEAKLHISSLKFGKIRAVFSKCSGQTFLALTKSASRPVLELFLGRVVELVRLLCGPDVSSVKVMSIFNKQVILAHTLFVLGTARKLGYCTLKTYGNRVHIPLQTIARFFVGYSMIWKIR